MSDELLPCPFCGNKDAIMLMNDSRRGTWWVLCDNCGARGNETDRESRAVEGWNSRTAAAKEE
jgi:Lar family restriction alleviation protein